MKAIEIQKPELERLYLREQRTMNDIARLYGCSQATVRNYMLKYGLPIRSKARAQEVRNLDSEKRNQGRPGEQNPNYRHGGYIQERIYRSMVELATCARCGAGGRLVVHHKNGDHFDNHPENLEPLCRSCHQSYHKQEWWNKHKTA